jgi:hypothetical protein
MTFFDLRHPANSFRVTSKERILRTRLHDISCCKSGMQTNIILSTRMIRSNNDDERGSGENLMRSAPQRPHKSRSWFKRHRHRLIPKAAIKLMESPGQQLLASVLSRSFQCSKIAIFSPTGSVSALGILALMLVVEVLFFTGADAFCGKRLLTAYDWCESCAVETVRYEEEMIDGIPRG